MWLDYPGSQPNPAPRPIVSMSLRPAIPRRVALQQSPPPLHRLLTMIRETGKLDKENSANGNCVFSSVSHPRGSPHYLCSSVFIRGLLFIGLRRPFRRGRPHVANRRAPSRPAPVGCVSVLFH